MSAEYAYRRKENRATFITRFKAFTAATFAPVVYGIFAIVWYLSLDGSLAFVNDQVWKLDVQTIVGIATVFILFFFLRAVDEIKDFEYDKKYNPDRPLVKGSVRQVDLWVYILLSIIVAVIINLLFSWIAALAVFIDMLYGLWLFVVEKFSSKIKNDIFLNLAITYPVNIGISLYIYFLFYDKYHIAWNVNGLLVIGIFAFAFLYLEFVRKTSWIKDASSGQRLYSNTIGPWPSFIITLLCGLAACVISILLFHPWTFGDIFYMLCGWLPIASLIIVGMGCYKFLKMRTRPAQQSDVAIMASFGKIYILVLYVSIVFHSFIFNRINWGFF